MTEEILTYATSRADEIIYLDNAATSWPKPPVVQEALRAFMDQVGASPGRSAHRLSVEAGRTVLDARLAVSRLIGVDDPLRIVFGPNATWGLNLATRGLLEPGDHVIVSSMEHNALMRPLRQLESEGVHLGVVPCAPDGTLDPDDIRAAICPQTRAICMLHASNVTGTLMPLEEVGRIAREHDLVFCVDAAQTAGCVPLDVEALHIDLLAFTGHKGLLGPQGTGGLYIGPGLEHRLRPLISGGTGSRSEFERQPDFLPDKFEAGTPNALGLAGLAASVTWILEQGVENIRDREEHLTALLLEQLADIPGLTLHGPRDARRQTAVISCTMNGLSPAEAAQMLDEQSGILTRPGLQCAPAAHRTMGTFPGGTLRLSPGYFVSEEQILRTGDALRRLLTQGG